MDKTYWNSFYGKNAKQINTCSDFCRFVIDYFGNYTTVENVLDAGCGNGRDSYVLAKRYNVVGMDNCGFTLDNVHRFSFANENFITADKKNYDLVYSRFTLHSINDEEQIEFLKSIHPGTYVAIEARSIKGADIMEHYGKDHYRNYIHLEKLRSTLEFFHYSILYETERNGLAIYKEEDPICVRVIAIRR